MTHFSTCLASSGLGPAYEQSNYIRYGPINEEAVRLIIRVCLLEKTCQPDMLAHTWMNESSFRLYLLPQTNEKSDPENVKDPDKWDHGPLQINRGLYRENVRLKYYHGLPEGEVFGPLFYGSDGKPAEFSGNPLANVQAGARHLMRVHGLWANHCVRCSLFAPAPVHNDDKVEGYHEFFPYLSLEEYRVGKYCGPDSRLHRVRSWRVWRPLLANFFACYSEVKP